MLDQRQDRVGVLERFQVWAAPAGASAHSVEARPQIWIRP